MGLKPQFSNATIVGDLEKFASEQESKFIEAMAYIGDEFVNAARSISTYQDQTGNLRSSIGYSVVKDGRTVSFQIEGDSAEGKASAADFLKSKVAEGPQEGIYLIVFAGMEYALYVEAKGYDVLTGSRPSRTEILNSFKDLLL